MELGAQLLETAKAGGFTPLEAMRWLDEVQNYARPLFVSPSASAPLRQALEGIHAQGELLRDVKSPADFKAALDKWKGRVPFKVSVQLSYDDSSALLEVMGTREDYMSRLSGMIATARLPSRWKDWEVLGVDWDDVQALAKTLDDVPHICKEDALASLRQQPVPTPEQVLEETGLLFVSLPAGASKATRDDLLRAVVRTNQELASATGVSGQVLGLGGQVGLTLARPIESSGYCAYSGGSGSVIATAPSSAAGPLAHEWLHALEHCLERTKELPKDAGLQACQQLRTVALALSDVNVDPKLLRKKGESLWKAWLAQSATSTVQEACKDWDWKTFQPTEETFSALRDSISASFPGETKNRASEHAILVLAQWDVLQKLESSPSVARQPWISFSKAFDAGMERWLGAKAAKSNDMLGYFDEVAERLAHGFEDWVAHRARQAGSAPVSTDIQEGAGVRYPTPPERVKHDAIWSETFAQLRPVLSQVAKAAPEALSAEIPDLAQARGRRQAKKTPPANPALAMAARSVSQKSPG